MKKRIMMLNKTAILFATCLLMACGGNAGSGGAMEKSEENVSIGTETETAEEEPVVVGTTGPCVAASRAFHVGIPMGWNVIDSDDSSITVGVDDEHRARELTHSEVFFPYALADDNEQQLSWAAFIGFQLIDGKTDCVVGEICDIEDSTINVVFHVKTAEGREVLIPAASELIQDVNQHDRQIEIMLPDGILDI